VGGGFLPLPSRSPLGLGMMTPLGRFHAESTASAEGAWLPREPGSPGKDSGFTDQRNQPKIIRGILQPRTGQTS
jgi:hypothetical protein